jgi:hypothetical protein
MLSHLHWLRAGDPFQSQGVTVPQVIRWVLVPLMRAWSAATNRDYDGIPRPTDATQTHSFGTDSDRILVFGSGPAVGWGVLSHDVALPGSLARALSARTGRGADVDVVPNPLTTIRTAHGARGTGRAETLALRRGRCEHRHD